jgi:hypothetical protein
LRAVGGAILLGNENGDGTDTWVTGLTSKGISADLITAGAINTGEIQIMNGEQPTFRWDSHGITAYAFDNEDSDIWISGMDKEKGVRFDRFGLYGYCGPNGEYWKPKNLSEIDQYSTFSLTWDGLKTTTQEGSVLRIGDNAKIDENDKTIFKITNPKQQATFRVDNEGHVEIAGSIKIGNNLEESNSIEDYFISLVGTNLYTNSATFEGEDWKRIGTNWDCPVGNEDSLGNIIAGRK